MDALLVSNAQTPEPPYDFPKVPHSFVARIIGSMVGKQSSISECVLFTRVTGSHDNAVRICERLIGIIINVEHASPHRWPQIICSQAEKKFKYARVKVVIETCAVLSRLVVGTVN